MAKYSPNRIREEQHRFLACEVQGSSRQASFTQSEPDQSKLDPSPLKLPRLHLAPTSPPPRNMCHRVECSNCHKATWRGCGNHIESALSGVAEKDRCAGYKAGKCPVRHTTCRHDRTCPA